MRNDKVEDKSLRVGIVGCGRIAEHHLKFLVKRNDISAIAIADQNIEQARKTGEKYFIDKCYPSIEELLEKEDLDVLHILTPPQYHYEQALKGIEKGIHLLIEKPLTLSYEHTDKLYSLASEKNLKICPNFIHLFNPLVSEAKSKIRNTNLGTLIYAECFWSINYKENRELHEAVGLHWSYELPGGVMQNNITHPLYLIMDSVGHMKNINVYPRQFGTLAQGITDHIDIMIEGQGSNGKISITTGLQQENCYLKLFFEKGTVTTDFITQSTIMEKINSVPRSINRVLMNFNRSMQLVSGSISNVSKVLRKKIVSYQGLQFLIDSFYECIVKDGPLPVSQELVLEVCKAEETISKRAGKLHFDNRKKLSKQRNITKKEKILVTGATGYVGSEMARQLVDAGYFTRAYVRKTSRTDKLERRGVEIYYGDIREEEPLGDAVKGIDIIVHVAASMKGSESHMYDVTVKGTMNVAKAAREANVKKVIYISSFSIYDYQKLRNGGIIKEKSLLESQADKRGMYSLAKRKAEDIAIENISASAPAWTILRPSLIFGAIKKDIISLVGPRIGTMLISFGDKKKHLKLIHVEDVARAVLYSIQNRSTDNEIFNISHEDPITVRELINLYHSSNGNRKCHPVYIPYSAGLIVSGILKGTRMILGGRVPDLNRVRLSYLSKDCSADSRAFRDATGWNTAADLKEQLKKETGTA